MSQFCSRYIGRSTSGLKVCVLAVSQHSKGARYSSFAGMEVSENFQRRQEKVDGVNISYIRTGSGPNALLCLPGALGE